MLAEATVIIPVLHQVDSWLDRCVRSALTQTAPAHVIVITSSLTPPSNSEILRHLSQQYSSLVVQQQSGKGFPNALNEGIRLAKTTRVGFLLSDDWLMPTAVEHCLNHDSDIVSTGCLVFAADGETLVKQAHRFLKRYIYDRLTTLQSKANYLSHFFLFKRDALLRVGGLDETIGDAPGVDDYDLIWTLLECGATVSIVEQTLYCYRDHEGERLTMRPPPEQIEGLLKILNKHGVPEPDRTALLNSHAIWFGKSMRTVLDTFRY